MLVAVFVGMGVGELNPRSVGVVVGRGVAVLVRCAVGWRVAVLVGRAVRVAMTVALGCRVCVRVGLALFVGVVIFAGVTVFAGVIVSVGRVRLAAVTGVFTLSVPVI